MNLQESIRRILREDDYSPAGKEITPNSIIVHKSNPMFRDKIMEQGLKVRAGECYKTYVGYGIKCKPAIFATNTTNKRAWFDSTYDDDIWFIDTRMIPDVKWYKDRHFESTKKHIVTFQDIPKEALTLKYEGTGSGDVKKWDKDSPNLYESIRRVLREEIDDYLDAISYGGHIYWDENEKLFLGKNLDRPRNLNKIQSRLVDLYPDIIFFKDGNNILIPYYIDGDIISGGSYRTNERRIVYRLWNNKNGYIEYGSELEDDLDGLINEVGNQLEIDGGRPYIEDNIEYDEIDEWRIKKIISYLRNKSNRYVSDWVKKIIPNERYWQHKKSINDISEYIVNNNLWDKVKDDVMNLQEHIKKVLRETLESKWNEGNYDYQYGYCHYFAYDIIGKIKKRFPNKKVNYYLQLTQEIDKYDGTVVQDYLIHVYIKIDDILLDSNGITTKKEASKRAEEWEQRQSYLVPETYETVVWEEESDEIPEIFFNNKFCNTGRVKKDVETFLSNPIVKRILRDK